MKKFYTLLLSVATVFAVSAQGPMKAKGDITSYDGTVDISMQISEGSVMELAKDMPVTITLEEQDASNVYELVLADFNLALTPGGDPIPLGDIVVPNVTFTDDNGDGIVDVAGSVELIALAEEQDQPIYAGVDITGSTDMFLNELALAIDVIWYMGYLPENPTMDNPWPIYVSFTGTKNAGVADLTGDAVSVYGVDGAVKVDGFSGVAEVYSVDGRLVKAQTIDNEAQIELAGGLYIVRVNGKSYKVAVR